MVRMIFFFVILIVRMLVTSTSGAFSNARAGPFCEGGCLVVVNPAGFAACARAIGRRGPPV